MEDAQSLGSSLSNSTNSTVYPFCYKIKETCLPCDSKGSEKNTTTDELMNNMKDTNVDNESTDESFEYLKGYGDIYKKLGILPYVKENKPIIFPDTGRINAQYNIFNRKVKKGEVPEEEIEETKMLYDILFDEELREKYNEFYPSIAEMESLNPYKSGINRIMGGKRKRTNKRKTNKRKTNKRRTNKRTTNKKR